MNRREKELLFAFLKELADSYDNNSCNDWICPKNWKSEEKIEFAREILKSTGRLEDFDAEDKNPCLFDVEVLQYITRKLKKELKDT